MAKYYFLLFWFLYGLYGHSQQCGWSDLLSATSSWSGDTDNFEISDKGWFLRDSISDTTTIRLNPDTPLTLIQLTLSLDFPPSGSNQFEMKLEFRSPDGDDSATILFLVGEPGNRDGLGIYYYSGTQLVNENELWPGEYGEGLNRSSWIIATSPAGLSIRNGKEDPSFFLAWEEKNSVDFYIHSITLICRYTKSRSSHFTFHHLYSLDPGGFVETHLLPGELFISEYRYDQINGENFIELFNALSEPVCIAGLSIQVNGIVVDIPPLRINPGYHIWLREEDADLPADPADGLIRLDLPVIAPSVLQEIRLFYYGRLIHVVWPPATDAGINLNSWEMVDITQPCRIDNWKNSLVTGGTAGNENSWFSTLHPPGLTFSWTERTVAKVGFPYLLFNHPSLDTLFTSNHAYRLISNPIRGEFELSFEEPVAAYDSIVVYASGLLSGCNHEVIKWDTVFISFPPQKGKPGGLLITELMYEPPASCPEYLEVSNVETWNSWWETLSLMKDNNQSIRLGVPKEWPEGESLILTSDERGFLNCYEEVDRELVYEVELFQLNNGGASLILKTKDPEIRTIDRVTYSPGDHNELFSSTVGVVLERNIHEPLNNKWRSGYVQFGYRSPGFIPDWNLNQGFEVLFSTNTIYAQGEREPSFLEIEFKTDGVDGTATIEIYDINGNQVQTLANAIPVQGGEIITWNGRTKSGRLLREGLYLFWIYYFDIKGHKRIFKRTCVLSN